MTTSSAWWAGGVLAIVALAASAEDGPFKSIEDLQVGDAVGVHVRIGTKRIVLPQGDWRLAVKGFRPAAGDGSNELGRMARVFLEEVRGQRLVRTMEIATLMQRSARRISWNEPPCEREGDVYWLKDQGAAVSDQFCTRVGFLTGVVDGARGDDYGAWARRIRMGGIGFSPEMPFVVVTRTARGDYLRMRMAFDPALSGIEGGAAQPRHLNPWHPANVSAGSDREGYYKALATWAPTFADAVGRLFDGDLSVAPAEFGALALPTRP